MEGDARDIACMAVKGKHSIGVARFNVIELNGVVPRSGKEAFVGGDAQSIHL